MKTRKILFDLMFIILSAAVLSGLDYYGLLEKYASFALLPILVAYFIGQYSAKKFATRKKEES